MRFEASREGFSRRPVIIDGLANPNLVLSVEERVRNRVNRHGRKAVGRDRGTMHLNSES